MVPDPQAAPQGDTWGGSKPSPRASPPIKHDGLQSPRDRTVVGERESLRIFSAVQTSSELEMLEVRCQYHGVPVASFPNHCWGDSVGLIPSFPSTGSAVII